MATKRLSLLAALAFLLGVAALTTTASAYNCRTTCYGNVCNTSCW
jgi:hypothetical protein